MDEKGLKVVELRVKNVMKIKAAKVSPGPHLVPVVGANGSGKTTLLECIRMAVAGGNAVPEKPIRDGEDRAEIVLDLGEYVIKRTFTLDGTYLHLETHTGQKIARPQDVLNKLYGSLAVDPMAFIRQSAKEQAQSLMRIANLDFTELDCKKSVAYEKRRDANRDVERLEIVERQSRKDWPIDLPPDEQKISELTVQLNELQKKVVHAKSVRSNIEILKNRLEQLAREMEGVNVQLSKLNESIPASIPSDDEIRDIQQRIGQAEQVNQSVRERNQYRRIKKDLDDARVTADQLDEQVKEIDSTKRKMLLDCKLPIEGLDFDADGVRFNGIPLSQASMAEKLRVSIAMAVAMNPRLRVILVKDASLLDKSNREVMEEMASKYDIQLWLEYIEHEGTGGIHIDNGMVSDQELVTA